MCTHLYGICVLYKSPVLWITRGFAVWRFRVKLNGGFAVNFYYFFEVKSGAKSLLMDGF